MHLLSPILLALCAYAFAAVTVQPCWLESCQGNCTDAIPLKIGTCQNTPEPPTSWLVTTGTKDMLSLYHKTDCATRNNYPRAVIHADFHVFSPGEQTCIPGNFPSFKASKAPYA